MNFRSDVTQYLDKCTEHRKIAVIVGNGFDLQALNTLGSGVSTSYRDFYYFARMHGLDSDETSHVILRSMENALNDGQEDWSDIEARVQSLYLSDEHEADEIYRSLRSIQRRFSAFLNYCVTSNHLATLGELSEQNGMSIASLSRFLGDLSKEQLARLKFGDLTDHYQLYDFLFFNLNYTPLLDDYLFLDQAQFEPRRFHSADRNFQFLPDPRQLYGGSSLTIWSSYVNIEVIHPHGYQDIPRSLLFGIDTGGPVKSNREPRRKLDKAYWAQSDFRYGSAMREAELFIIFGASLGDTDRWWWRSIRGGLEQNPAELIIYSWTPADDAAPDEDSVVNRFLAASGLEPKECEQSSLRDRIFVVSYSDKTDRCWLNTSPAAEGSWRCAKHP